jgi:ubiquinone/menaquinone biosynthesis C-methylase UbiE
VLPGEKKIKSSLFMPSLKAFAKRLLGDQGSRIEPSPLKAPTEQNLNPYWSDEFAQVLETWGEKNAWHELNFLMASRKGKVLDIACGTGKNISDLNKLLPLDVYGCDISDFLIDKAVARGIDRNKLTVCNATQLPFETCEFAYSYSIGSLEHFDLAGLDRAIAESARVTEYTAFHQVPTARNEQENGWIERSQAYWNNPTSWWLEKFANHFREVIILTSLWEDDESIGHWFVCSK